MFWDALCSIERRGPEVWAAHASIVRCARECHILVPNIVPSVHFLCDDCSRSLPIGDQIHSCRECNYDLCARCVVNNAAAVAVPPPESPLMFEPPLVFESDDDDDDDEDESGGESDDEDDDNDDEGEGESIRRDFDRRWSTKGTRRVAERSHVVSQTSVGQPRFEIPWKYIFRTAVKAEDLADPDAQLPSVRVARHLIQTHGFRVAPRGDVASSDLSPSSTKNGGGDGLWMPSRGRGSLDAPHLDGGAAEEDMSALSMRPVELGLAWLALAIEDGRRCRKNAKKKKKQKKAMIATATLRHQDGRDDVAATMTLKLPPRAAFVEDDVIAGTVTLRGGGSSVEAAPSSAEAWQRHYYASCGVLEVDSVDCYRYALGRTDDVDDRPEGDDITVDDDGDDNGDEDGGESGRCDGRLGEGRLGELERQTFAAPTSQDDSKWSSSSDTQAAASWLQKQRQADLAKRKRRTATAAAMLLSRTLPLRTTGGCSREASAPLPATASGNPWSSTPAMDLDVAERIDVLTQHMQPTDRALPSVRQRQLTPTTFLAFILLSSRRDAVDMLTDYKRRLRLAAASRTPTTIAKLDDGCSTLVRPIGAEGTAVEDGLAATTTEALRSFSTTLLLDVGELRYVCGTLFAVVLRVPPPILSLPEPTRPPKRLGRVLMPLRCFLTALATPTPSRPARQPVIGIPFLRFLGRRMLEAALNHEGGEELHPGLTFDAAFVLLEEEVVVEAVPGKRSTDQATSSENATVDGDIPIFDADGGGRFVHILNVTNVFFAMSSHSVIPTVLTTEAAMRQVEFSGASTTTVAAHGASVCHFALTLLATLCLGDESMANAALQRPDVFLSELRRELSTDGGGGGGGGCHTANHYESSSPRILHDGWFQTEEDDATSKKQQTRSTTLPSSLLSDDCREVLLACLADNPQVRPRLNDLARHPFFFAAPEATSTPQVDCLTRFRLPKKTMQLFLTSAHRVGLSTAAAASAPNGCPGYAAWRHLWTGDTFVRAPRPLQPPSPPPAAFPIGEYSSAAAVDDSPRAQDGNGSFIPPVARTAAAAATTSEVVDSKDRGSGALNVGGGDGAVAVVVPLAKRDETITRALRPTSPVRGTPSSGAVAAAPAAAPPPPSLLAWLLHGAGSDQQLPADDKVVLFVEGFSDVLFMVALLMSVEGGNMAAFRDATSTPDDIRFACPIAPPPDTTTKKDAAAADGASDVLRATSAAAALLAQQPRRAVLRFSLESSESSPDRLILALQKYGGVPPAGKRFLFLRDNDLKLVSSHSQRGEFDSAMTERRWTYYHRLRFGRAVENYLLPIVSPLALLHRDPWMAFLMCIEVSASMARLYFPVFLPNEGGLFPGRPGDGWVHWPESSRDTSAPAQRAIEFAKRVVRRVLVTSTLAVVESFDILFTLYEQGVRTWTIQPARPQERNGRDEADGRGNHRESLSTIESLLDRLTLLREQQLLSEADRSSSASATRHGDEGATTTTATSSSLSLGAVVDPVLASKLVSGAPIPDLTGLPRRIRTPFLWPQLPSFANYCSTIIHHDITNGYLPSMTTADVAALPYNMWSDLMAASLSQKEARNDDGCSTHGEDGRRDITNVEGDPAAFTTTRRRNNVGTDDIKEKSSRKPTSPPITAVVALPASVRYFAQLFLSRLQLALWHAHLGDLAVAHPPEVAGNVGLPSPTPGVVVFAERLVPLALQVDARTLSGNRGVVGRRCPGLVVPFSAGMSPRDFIAPSSASYFAHLSFLPTDDVLKKESSAPKPPLDRGKEATTLRSIRDGRCLACGTPCLEHFAAFPALMRHATETNTQAMAGGRERDATASSSSLLESYCLFASYAWDSHRMMELLHGGEKCLGEGGGVGNGEGGGGAHDPGRAEQPDVTAGAVAMGTGSSEVGRRARDDCGASDVVVLRQLEHAHERHVLDSVLRLAEPPQLPGLPAAHHHHHHTSNFLFSSSSSSCRHCADICQNAAKVTSSLVSLRCGDEEHEGNNEKSENASKSEPCLEAPRDPFPLLVQLREARRQELFQLVRHVQSACGRPVAVEEVITTAKKTGGVKTSGKGVRHSAIDSSHHRTPERAM